MVLKINLAGLGWNSYFLKCHEISASNEKEKEALENLVFKKKKFEQKEIKSSGLLFFFEYPRFSEKNFNLIHLDPK